MAQDNSSKEEKEIWITYKIKNIICINLISSKFQIQCSAILGERYKGESVWEIIQYNDKTGIKAKNAFFISMVKLESTTWVCDFSYFHNYFHRETLIANCSD